MITMNFLKTCDSSVIFEVNDIESVPIPRRGDTVGYEDHDYKVFRVVYNYGGSVDVVVYLSEVRNG